MYYYQVENLKTISLVCGEPNGFVEITKSKPFRRYGKALEEGLKEMYALVHNKNLVTYGLSLRVIPVINAARSLFYCELNFKNNGTNLQVHDCFDCNAFTIPDAVLKVAKEFKQQLWRSQHESLSKQFKTARQYAKAIQNAESEED